MPPKIVATKQTAKPESAVVRGLAEGTGGDRVGVYGKSDSNVGVWGVSHGTEPAVYGQGNLAGQFDGAVEITGGVQISGQTNVTGRVVVAGDMEVAGDIRLTKADFAEDFDMAEGESIGPGTVMVLGERGLQPSEFAYDKRVVGVVSGAGSYEPGIILDRQHGGNRRPIGLVGKVYCSVDAEYAEIEMGDLLTTSGTPGHAMKATDPLSAFGAVIGKALSPFRKGRGLIPILISLQ